MAYHCFLGITNPPASNGNQSNTTFISRRKELLFRTSLMIAAKRPHALTPEQPKSVEPLVALNHTQLNASSSTSTRVSAKRIAISTSPLSSSPQEIILQTPMLTNENNAAKEIKKKVHFAPTPKSVLSVPSNEPPCTTPDRACTLKKGERKSQSDLPGAAPSTQPQRPTRACTLKKGETKSQFALPGAAPSIQPQRPTRARPLKIGKIKSQFALPGATPSTQPQRPTRSRPLKKGKTYTKKAKSQVLDGVTTVDKKAETKDKDVIKNAREPNVQKEKK